MARKLNKKITLRCTEIQQKWLSEYAGKNNTTIQSMITEYLEKLGMPDKNADKIDENQMSIFDYLK